MILNIFFRNIQVPDTAFVFPCRSASLARLEKN